MNSATNYVLRTRTAGDLGKEVHAVFRQIAPGFAIDNLQSMRKTVDGSNFSERLGFYLIGSFAGLAVVMVMVGLYGVLSQVVGQRRQEIGVRMAVGASSRSILLLVLRRGSLLITIGLLAGAAAALAMNRLLASFLYGVRPTDIPSYVVTAFTLLVVGLVAALIPARRAAAIEPIEALRME